MNTELLLISQFNKKSKWVFSATRVSDGYPGNGYSNGHPRAWAVPITSRWCFDAKHRNCNNNLQRDWENNRIIKTDTHLPCQIQCFWCNHRLHVRARYFHSDVNTTGCCFNGTGYFRLIQNQDNKQCYFNHSILLHISQQHSLGVSTVIHWLDLTWNISI